VGLRAGLFRVQDWLSVRAHREDLPYLRRALALEPGFRLVDMGGGTGAYTAVFAAGCEEIVVLEPDRRKVAYGERRRPHVQFVAGQAEEIPFPDDHFDRATALVSLHHVQDQDRALQEVHRVLKPGGRFVIEEFDPREGRGKRAHIFESTFGGGHSTFFTPEDLRAKLEKHGLRGIAHEAVGPGYLLTAEA
jgi:demethylmenaquinone methyltransferase/2-methoxy-6-polyprenyl-1,4-benzoquinol methylase